MGDSMLDFYVDPAPYGGKKPGPFGAIEKSAYTTGANSIMTATLAAPATTNRIFVCGFYIGGLGATAAAGKAVSITGLVGGQRDFIIPIPAGATVGVPPLFIDFTRPLVGLQGTAVQLVVAAYGTGNTSAQCAIWGFEV